MLMPKRVKHRRVMRGRLKGEAHRGNKITYGEFGLQAAVSEPLLYGTLAFYMRIL